MKQIRHKKTAKVARSTQVTKAQQEAHDRALAQVVSLVQTMLDELLRATKARKTAKTVKAAKVETKFVVHVKKMAIVGFRYSSMKDAPGKGENLVRDGEVRVTSHLMAVLGLPSSLQNSWSDKDSAQYIADAVHGRVVAVTAVAKKRA